MIQLLLVRSLFNLFLKSQLDDAAGAEAIRAQLDEMLRIREGSDAARRLDLHIRSDMRLEQRDVLKGRSALGRNR